MNSYRCLLISVIRVTSTHVTSTFINGYSFRAKTRQGRVGTRPTTALDCTSGQSSIVPRGSRLYP
nr:MAG TPA: hypothetical protein [Caudoviricetes sp.]